MKTFQKPLTAGEEAYYIKQSKSENVQEAKRAKDILVERNMRLVAHIVKKYDTLRDSLNSISKNLTPCL